MKENTQNMSKLLPAMRATGVRVWGAILLFRTGLGVHTYAPFPGAVFAFIVLVAEAAALPLTVLRSADYLRSVRTVLDTTLNIKTSLKGFAFVVSRFRTPED